MKTQTKQQTPKRNTNRPKSFDVYQAVTDRIIELLEKGVVPWQAPSRARVGLPRNFSTGKASLPVLTRASIAHFYFVCIHPFEDGNGRIARAIAEKVISEGLDRAALIALSRAINSKRKTYYEMLERSSKGNEITDWLVYFAKTILEAQEDALALVDFTIAKAVMRM